MTRLLPRSTLFPYTTLFRSEAGLKSKILGQEDAIHQVVEMYQMYVSGMSSPGRPIANLMFLGPTGSGKTRLVEATAECLRSEEHTSELQSLRHLVCRLLLEK